MKKIIFYPLSIFITFFENISNYFNLMLSIFRSYKSWDYYLKITNLHMYQIGVKSIPIVIITGLFAGMVLAVAYQLVIGETVISRRNGLSRSGGKNPWDYWYRACRDRDWAYLQLRSDKIVSDLTDSHCFGVLARTFLFQWVN